MAVGSTDHDTGGVTISRYLLHCTVHLSTRVEAHMLPARGPVPALAAHAVRTAKTPHPSCDIM